MKTRAVRNFVLILIFFGCIPVSVFSQQTCFEASDSNICYESFGKGYPVVIINGGPGMNSAGFASLAKLLSDSNQTIIYDQRGTGNSDISKIDSSTMTLDLMVQDLEDLRKHLGFKEWIVLGHSFGGMLAYYYAVKHPESITAMIQSHSGGMDLSLFDGPSVVDRLTASEIDSLAYYSRLIAEDNSNYKARLGRGRALASAYLYNDEFKEQIAERLTQGNMQINSLVWQNMRRINFDTKDELRNFQKPVLILGGKNEVVSEDIAKEAHATLPNSKLVLMENCGHYGWLERPDIYLKEVREFLKEHSV